MEPRHYQFRLSPLAFAPSRSPSPFTSGAAPLYADGIPSPISLPEVRLSKYSRLNSSQSASDSYLESPSDGFSVSELETPETRPRIPRPANAFLLFRSNMTKTKAIPAKAEKRQQQLSKVAGECWHLLPPAEKQVWYDKAAELLKEHVSKYPDYKFTPAARGTSRKAKGKEAQSAEEDKDRIRELREKWTHVYGPAASPTRRRKPKQKEHSLARSEPDPEIDSLLPALSFTDSRSSSSLPSSPSGSVDDILPPMFPNPSYPHYPENQPLNFNYNSGAGNERSFPRSPSASSNQSSDIPFTYSGMFFDDSMSSSASSGGESHSPSSDIGLSAGFNDLNITPTAASFENNTDSPPGALRKALSFTALAGQITYEPPFLAPLVPPPSDLVNSFTGQNSMVMEGAPTGPYSVSLASNLTYDSAQFDELDFGSLDSFLSMETNAFLNDWNRNWNFSGDGGFDM